MRAGKTVNRPKQLKTLKVYHYFFLSILSTKKWSMQKKKREEKNS